ncbi:MULTISPECIES: hypothetical protein [unclassified Bradyrhizobium]|uniref:hypothetical protein n=1 Tax=unclassified Bradyrhizobium TaxID=2631580 RepID=UPI00247AD04D|nr:MULTISPECIES: hypothetical protein [unclassified Bradyrhizobium]WGS21087.1 hypothetical protein MTX22_04785 [Bradyrhizobium sp. ISRA463]WGS28004.1 hypothetical protein MTX19_02635 [Bradyrhizobium sp. ISRA464]
MNGPQSTSSVNTMAGAVSRMAIRRYVANKWFLLAVAGLALIGITAASWSWLVAAGIASVLLSVLPCLVMCGLGLCMHKFIGGSGAPRAPGSPAADPSAVSARPAPDSTPAYGSNCCGEGLGVPADTLAENPGTQVKESTHA